ncbi:MAG: site-specific DNA-methyltransferase [Candidatus Pacebacteria bacterium]|nr:site-specific DNA-methyltransferase [Candidatus Paceibacterota bacterium]
MKYELKLGDNAETLKQYPDNHFDSIVTDPPYGIEFMGKDWDKHTGAVETWNECFRVLKPGGHILAFSASRTYHHLATNIESVGFEIRDQIMWIYGSGFPKSANLGKAIDKKQGNKRIKTGQIKTHARKGVAVAEERTAINAGSFGQEVEEELTVGTSDWEGWGTALKPAHEPIVMARKPLSEKTIAENVLKHGTGGINIDESRVETEDKTQRVNRGVEWGVRNDKSGNEPKVYGSTKGRYPANVIHDGSEEVLEGFPETKGRHGMTQHGSGTNTKYGKFARTEQSFVNDGVGDSGSAARFFYCSKVSKKERNIGQSTDGKNNHPTVKPVALMKYLITLITPKGGKVLDPFNGSGSTGMACVELGYEYTGCELDPDYIEISKVRIEAWYAENKPEEVNEYFDKI